MAKKLPYHGINPHDCTKDDAIPEKKPSASRYCNKEILTLLQAAPVPKEFRRSVQRVMPDPQLSTFTSMNALAAGSAPCPQITAPAMMKNQEPTGFLDASNNATRSFCLTEAMVNLARPEQTTPGLKFFDGRPLSTLVTNTYFLEPSFYPPIYWCPVPEKKPCNGMYFSYSKKDEKLVEDLIKIMADCGLPVKLESGDQWCGEKRCCKNVKDGTLHRRVVITDRAKVPWHMSRIAAMIDGAIAPPKAKKGRSAFCIAVNSNPAAIDWYARNPNEDSQFNPNRLPPKGQTLPYKGGSAKTDPPGKTFQRRRYDLLAHVIAENFWGRNCYDSYKNYYYAHRLALIEENWIRRATKRSAMLWELDSQGKEVKGLPSKAGNVAALRQMDEALVKLCKTKATVTCNNNCPGGPCCADPETPFGWTSCKDICNC